MKKFLSTLLALTMLPSLCVPALAVENTAGGTDTTQAVTTAQDPGKAAADVLHELGLFNGVGIGADGKPIYDLDRAPTRLEALIMLVRLLGKEQEALAGTWKHPFTDVPDWGNAIVGYAYEHKLTGGVAATLYGSEEPATVSMYLTFVLRAMGYQDPDEFQWDSAWTLTDKLGITDGTAQEGTFLRGDVAAISLKALPALQKDGTTLASRLIESGVFTEEQAVKVGVLEKATDLLAVVNKSTNTSHDIEHPNGDMPAISMKEAGQLISKERAIVLGTSDPGLTPAGYTQTKEDDCRAVEWEKYVQVTDDVVGVMQSSVVYDKVNENFHRIITLNIETYAGKTLRFNGADLGMESNDLNGHNEESTSWWTSDKESSIKTTVANNIVTMTTKVNTAQPTGGSPIMGTSLSAVSFTGYNSFQISKEYNGRPYQITAHDNFDFLVGVTVYHQPPKTMEPSFTLRPQYSQSHYVKWEAAGGVGVNDTIRVWDVEDGADFDPNQPSRVVPDNEMDWLRVYPGENSGVPENILSSEGYVPEKSLEKYYRIEIISAPGTVGTASEGNIWAPDAKSHDIDQKLTVRVTSRYDGTSADIDFVVRYAGE